MENTDLIAYWQNPSVELRNKIVVEHRKLVTRIARRISRQCVTPREDLEQVGYLGLINAVERYDPHRNHAFGNFASVYIRGVILRSLRDKEEAIRVPCTLRDLSTKIRKTTRKLTATLKRHPSDSEIMAAAGINSAKYQEYQLALKNRIAISIDCPTNWSAPESPTIGDNLVDWRGLHKQETNEERIILAEAIRKLSSRQQDALKFVYIQGLTQKETARAMLFKDSMTVSRILKSAIAELKTLCN